MIQRFKNSWNLLSASVDVLLQNPKLLLFPFMTFVCTMAIAAFFLGTFLFQPTGHSYSDKAHWKAVAASVFTAESLARTSQPHAANEKRHLQFNNMGLAAATGIYFVSMFLATFFNVAFYHEIWRALRKEPIGLRQGFAFALTRLKSILLWSLFAGLIGYLIKLAERRLGLIGRLIAGIIGLTWSVAAIFAIPVIVCEENSNPIAVLKSSAHSLKKTWGETLIGFVGLGLGTWLAIFSSFFLFGGIAVAGTLLGSGLAVATAAIAWVFFIFSFGYFVAVADNVFRCALYVFASTGAIPNGYTSEMMDLAWRRKKI